MFITYCRPLNAIIFLTTNPPQPRCRETWRNDSLTGGRDLWDSDAHRELTHREMSLNSNSADSNLHRGQTRSL